MARQWAIAIFLSLFLFGTNGTPPPTPYEQTMRTLLRQDDFGFITKTLPQDHKTGHALRTSFRNKYVGYGGGIQSYAGSGPWLKVEATQRVSATAHQRAALIVSRVVAHMPYDIFNKLASSAKVGVFTKAETLLAFPEYASLSHSTTFDGRPYSSLAGTGGQVAVMVDDNVLCDSQDPYRHQANMLVHEFAHTILNYGVPASIKAQVQSAYNAAHRAGTWSNQYIMSNVDEYWAESTQVFFNVEHLTYTTGGMNTCGRSMCSSEQQSRNYIRSRDHALYNVLSYVYTSNRPDISSYLSVCVTG